MLCNNKLREPADILAFGIDTASVIILRAMNKTYDVGILLDCTRFTKVGELRALVFVASVFEFTVKLRKSDYRNIELLGHFLESLRDGRYFLLS